MWVLPSSGVFGAATFTIYTQNLINSTGTLPAAVVSDYGTGTSPPKVGYKTPLAHVKNYEYDTAGVTDLWAVTANVAGTLVCHVTVMQCISA